MNGHYDDGRYHLSTSRSEVEYYNKMGNHLLSRAEPLMDIFLRENMTEFQEFLEKSYSGGEGTYCNIFSAPPLYTISDELLLRILSHNNITEEQSGMILDAAQNCRKQFESLAAHCAITDCITEITKEELEAYPVRSLMLHDIFFENDISYTYEEYLEHIKQTMEYAEKFENYSCSVNANVMFRNIQLRMSLGEFVIVSKNKAPAIHFVIKHPQLREAIEKMRYTL